MQLNKHNHYLEELKETMLYEMNLLYKQHKNIVNYKKLAEIFNCSERYVHLILRGQGGRATFVKHYKKFKDFYAGLTTASKKPQTKPPRK